MAKSNTPDSRGNHSHHILPRATLFKIFGTLVALTILTVITAQLNLGGLDVPLALAIATTKVVLVMLYFMGLKYDNRVNAMVFSVGVILVFVFITFTLFDTQFRGDLPNVGRETIADETRREEALRERERQFQQQAQPLAPLGGSTSQQTTPANDTDTDSGADTEGQSDAPESGGQGQ